MYAKCGSVEDAWRAFTKMPSRNVVSWNVIILGCAKCGLGQKALESVEQMQSECVQPDPVTFVRILNACDSLQALEEDRRAHRQMIEIGCDCNVFIGNSLTDMYAKCGSIKDAWECSIRCLHKMWSLGIVMIVGYVKCGQGQKSSELFHQMQQEGVQPDSVTFIRVLNAEMMTLFAMPVICMKQRM
jgi:pentatricopeptide repeat protein